MEQSKQEQSQEKIAEWVDTFLRGEGNNIGLADGLQKQRRFWLGPVNVPLDRLTRSCGPEEGMEYQEPEESWHRRVDSLAEHIKAGGELPPFIATYKQGSFSLRDGNHRYGACERLQEKGHQTYIWCDSESEFEEMKKALNAH